MRAREDETQLCARLAHNTQGRWCLLDWVVKQAVTAMNVVYVQARAKVSFKEEEQQSCWCRIAENVRPESNSLLPHLPYLPTFSYRVLLLSEFYIPPSTYLLFYCNKLYRIDWA